MRTPILAGNWKLNKTIEEAQHFVRELAPLIADFENVDIVLCPVFTALSATSQVASSTRIKVAAQDTSLNKPHDPITMTIMISK